MVTCPCVPSSRRDYDSNPAGSHPLSFSPHEPIRVLVVDDDARVRAAIRQTIAFEDDFRLVGEAADAPTATALADETGPSVALVDVLVPDDTTGLALVRRLGQRSAVPLSR